MNYCIFVNYNRIDYDNSNPGEFSKNCTISYTLAERLTIQSSFGEIIIDLDRRILRY